MALVFRLPPGGYRLLVGRERADGSLATVTDGTSTVFAFLAFFFCWNYSYGRDKKTETWTLKMFYC